MRDLKKWGLSEDEESTHANKLQSLYVLNPTNGSLGGSKSDNCELFELRVFPNWGNK